MVHALAITIPLITLGIMISTGIINYLCRIKCPFQQSTLAQSIRASVTQPNDSLPTYDEAIQMPPDYSPPDVLTIS